MLTGKFQNTAEIATWGDIPLKPGMGLHDEGLETLYSNVVDLEIEGPIGESDISHFDWSMQEWEFEAEKEGRTKLSGGSGTVWESIIAAHYYCMARKVFVLIDGTMIAQQLPGIMPSGWYNTSRGNSYV